MMKPQEQKVQDEDAFSQRKAGSIDDGVTLFVVLSCLQFDSTLALDPKWYLRSMSFTKAKLSRITNRTTEDDGR